MQRLLPWLEGRRLLALLLLGCGLAAVLLGPDRSWDTRNYHLYVPWSLLVGGRPQDVVAAGMQGFHNPTLDLPFAALVVALNDWPWLVAVLMGLPAGLALWLVFRVARMALGEAVPGARWLALLAMAGAAGGAILRSQVGTASGDVTSGALVLAALIPALAAARIPDWRPAALAGLLCGVAIGLKLTNAPYAIALAACLAAVPGPVGPRARGTLLLGCAAGGLAGVLLAYGWWGLVLWDRYGNPLFPYFQAVFAPGWDGTAVGSDARFLPAGLLDALARPFHWAVSTTPIATEEKMRDPRVAAGLVAALAVLGWPAARRRLPLLVPLSVFVLLGFAVWAGLFGIYRYAFVLEALSPLLVLGLLAVAMEHLARWTLAVAGALVALGALVTVPIPSGRAVPAARYLDIAWPRLPADAVVLQVEPPTAFLAVGLPPGIILASPYGVGELNAGPFRRRLEALLAEGRPLYLLAPDGSRGWERLKDWGGGLEAVPETCRRTCTNWSAQGAGPLVCSVRRPGDAAPPPAPAWSAPAMRLCEAAAGLGLESAGRRGLGFERAATLDLGAGCRLAEIRTHGAEGAGLRLEPAAETGSAGAVLRVVPPRDGVVRLAADRPVVLTAAACLAR